MSILKTILGDFVKSEPPTAGAIRTQGIAFLFVGICCFSWFLLETFITGGDVIPFDKVQANNIELPKPVSIETSVGNFGYSEQPVLLYKTKSFLDRLIFNSIGPFNIIDFLFILYVGIILFKALRKVEEDNIFRIRISKAYRDVGKGCFFVWLMHMLYSSIIFRKHFEYRMGDEFYLLRDHSIPLFFLYPVFGGIFLSFVYFMNKGEDLQQDNDLTI
ncbi:hypothetical protein [Aridibaculum aurantiacum]|uniref:hypothetical protein n=1 Tax=Aridibaculum aurantiacum TaxID=2810307 RepID=UPI001A97501F|nr:hypothetical protein [Aridibaculum aurantiacum]